MIREIADGAPVDRSSRVSILHESSSPLGHALGAGTIALLAGCGAVYLAVVFDWPWAFDFNSDGFNPVLLIQLALIGAVIWFGASAVWSLMRYRQFGVTRLDLDNVPQLGAPMAGRVISERPVPAAEDYLLVLTCYDIHEFEQEDGKKHRRRSFPVWSEEVKVTRDIDAREGLPFRFHLPASVGAKPVASGILPGDGVRSRFTVHVPGMRQVIASNHPPVERIWVLRVTARSRGPAFLAEFRVPVED